jgi:hypothetical protein
MLGFVLLLTAPIMKTVQSSALQAPQATLTALEKLTQQN